MALYVFDHFYLLSLPGDILDSSHGDDKMG